MTTTQTTTTYNYIFHADAVRVALAAEAAGATARITPVGKAGRAAPTYKVEVTTVN
jgi:hypothetical protein